MAYLPEKLVELLSSSEFETTLKNLKKDNINYKKERKPLFDKEFFKIRANNVIKSNSSFSRLTQLDKQKYKSFTHLYYEPFLAVISKAVIEKERKKISKVFSSAKEKLKIPFNKDKNGNIFLKVLLGATILFAILDKNLIKNFTELIKKKFTDASALAFEAFKKKFNEKLGKNGGNATDFLKETNEDISYLINYYFDTIPKFEIDKESLRKLLLSHNISPNITNILGSIRGTGTNMGSLRKIYKKFYKDKENDAYIFKFHAKNKEEIESLKEKINKDDRKLLEYALNFAENDIFFDNRTTVLNTGSISNKLKSVDDYEKVESETQLWNSGEFLDIKENIDDIILNLENLRNSEAAQKILKNVRTILPTQGVGADLDLQKKYHKVLKILIDANRSLGKEIKAPEAKNKISEYGTFLKDYLLGNKNFFIEAKKFFTFEKLTKFNENPESLAYEMFYKTFEREMNFFVDVVTEKFYKVSDAKYVLSKKDNRINLKKENMFVDKSITISEEGYEEYNKSEVKSIAESQRNFYKISKILDNLVKNDNIKEDKILEKDGNIVKKLKNINSIKLAKFIKNKNKKDKANWAPNTPFVQNKRSSSDNQTPKNNTALASSQSSNPPVHKDQRLSSSEIKKSIEGVKAMIAFNTSMKNAANIFAHNLSGMYDERLKLHMDMTRTIVT